ncbi:hypothetical protein G6011_06400 [Alternaria panax]|uniref:F-box domain-containing protein n=1 Tax=Alternaria panax TaxID=48097 RepID=A0AAD4FGA6_9PLEO|nr:hypothetical protein G6011_06400 [Alternaria panax]
MNVNFFRYAADELKKLGVTFEVLRKAARYEKSNKLLVKAGWTTPVPHSVGEAMIEKLPMKLANELMGYLPPHDLTKLARASKRCHDFAQSLLWGSIELHRKDAHHKCFTLSKRNYTREYLDDQLRDPWSYRNCDSTDVEFNLRNLHFGAAIKQLCEPTGISESWGRLAPLVRHLCLTVTPNSPSQIWNTILSLPDLNTLEVIGEHSQDRLGPPAAQSLRRPVATKVQNVRLRGYIPVEFVSAICKASASSIESLDFGVLEKPQFFKGCAYEELCCEETGFPLCIAPQGIL